MGCSCKDNEGAIQEGYKVIAELRELFIKRMTVDSETQDRRRKDYNQALFSKADYNGEWYQIWNEITPDMVMQCFDDAVKDWRRTYCDVEGCKRK